ncbi:arsenate reductase (glutaredoxin) [Paroceanicella profunda]|uniref:Arsenate reductase n=1 Tax=Paroceanicella profunda TaxID=2579971 RepID=A0A5B8G001_9RHOB|nr:arsenate reductase (glutaredoxin) [Paroceanicella profunda]QDL92349.1 arsenate reductase (glutaredoxin) [Paroceanicella profunda]
MTWKIYHNPACGTSRNVLAKLRAAGLEPEVIAYLDTPPDRETLLRLIAEAGLTPRAALREKGTDWRERGLDAPDVTDARIIDAMLAHPILINRPLVTGPHGTKLCRPSETVDALIAGARPD